MRRKTVVLILGMAIALTTACDKVSFCSITCSSKTGNFPVLKIGSL